MAQISQTATARAAPVAWSPAARKYAVEGIGTFFLVFAVSASVLSNSVFTPLAAGGTLMVMIYAGGHISGGHFNPAVTMAVLWRRRIALHDAIGYWAAQIAAGLVAAAVARSLITPAAVHTLVPAGRALVAAGVVELLFTFALCWVVLNVATSDGQPLLRSRHRLHRRGGRIRRRRHLGRLVQSGGLVGRRGGRALRLVDDLGVPARRARRRGGGGHDLPRTQPDRHVTTKFHPNTEILND